MCQYKQMATALVVATSIGLSAPLMASEGAQDETPEIINTLGIESYGMNSLVFKNEEGDIDSQTYANVVVRLTDQFKARIAVNLEKLYDSMEEGTDVDVDAIVAQLEGILTINQESGNPVLIIVGKSLDVRMKQDLAAVMRSDKTISQPIELEEVLGLTVEIQPKALVDYVQLSVHETEGGDMSWGDEVRITARAYKVINEMITLHASASYETGGDDEDAGALSLGIVVDLEGWVGAEGLESFFQMTYYEQDYGSLEEGTLAVDTGLNWDINEDATMTFGMEYVDGVTEVINPHIGFSYQISDRASVYGSIGHDIKSDDTKLEMGLSIQDPFKKR